MIFFGLEAEFVLALADGWGCRHVALVVEFQFIFIVLVRALISVHYAWRGKDSFEFRSVLIRCLSDKVFDVSHLLCVGGNVK